MATATEVEPTVAEVEQAEIDDGPGVEESLFRLTVDQYHKMADAGILDEASKVELLDGVLVQKISQKPPHFVANQLVLAFLGPICPAGWFLSMACPMTILERDSEPEPDVQLVRGRPRDYLERANGPGDAGLLVEVAHSSYRIDRKTKLPIYAAAGVQTYWLLDLNRRRLEVFTDPSGPAESPTYRNIQTLGPDDEVAVALDGVEIGRTAVRELLP